MQFLFSQLCTLAAIIFEFFQLLGQIESVWAIGKEQFLLRKNQEWGNVYQFLISSSIVYNLLICPKQR